MGYDQQTHREFWNEIRRAWQRITGTPGGPMGWILNFAQRDLEPLVPSEWNLLAFEVAAFAFQFPVSAWGNLSQEDVWSVRLFHGEQHLVASLPSRKEGQELRTMLLSHLNQFVSTKSLSVSIPKLTIEIDVERLPQLDRPIVSAVVKMDRVAKRFEYCFAHLLAHHAPNVRRCQECSRIFLAKRHDQIYCTSRCQTRVASRKWRDEHRSPSAAPSGQPKRKRSASSTTSAEGGAHGTKRR
jgi:hypothetical protein